jgi:uncharacterized protein with von Willebrand factor type A (vWA) domain
MPWHYRYSSWDGTQTGEDLEADEVLGELTDDLLYHGDLNAALRRLMQSGFRDRSGEQVAGLRQLLEQLRRRRQEELERWDLGGVYEDIAEALREVMDTERGALEDLARRAQASGDRRRAEIAEEMAAERRLQLDLVPPDLAGQVQALQQYDFASAQARDRFEQLLDQLREELVGRWFKQTAGSLQRATPESLERTRQMFGALNRMLEQRQAGRPLDPSFESFMERFGDLFPGQPSNLDELLEQLARQLASMQAMLDSMSPEQQAQLQALADSLLSDLDLRWQVERLAANLQGAFPDAGWGQQFSFRGPDPLGLGQAASVMEALSDMDRLENLLRSAHSPGALADVDLERARELLGDQAARSLERLAQLARLLQEAGLTEQREGRLELTPRGMRRIGHNALADLFARLTKDRTGRHPTDRPGAGHERQHDAKPYEWGDPFNLSIERTVRNAIQRHGPGKPVNLLPQDFEVERTESLTRSSTVLMIDLSLSMPMRDNFLAAKKVAMALHALISTRYPRDYLGLVGFSEVARELTPRQLPEVSWDFVYGTNMQHALVLARRMLARQAGTKQIIMITDGEPTAHVLPGGDVYFNYPPVPETVQATLAEVARCTREGIRINTFMLDATRYLRAFVEQMTRVNRGRAFFTTPEDLGDYVLVDFLEHKRSLRSGRRRPA